MTGILSSIERAYCLVLDKRWEFMPTIVENFNKLDLWHKARFYICGDGSNIDLSYDHIDVKELPPKYPNSTDYPTWWARPNAYNAWLCHFKILQEALASGYKHILLMEDDAIIEPDFFEILEKVEKKLANINIDMLYLGAYHYPGSTIKTDNDSVLRMNGSGGWHGVVLSRNVIAELVHNWGYPRGPFDQTCGRYLHSLFDCYAVYPSIISQRDNIHSYVEDQVLQKPARDIK